MYERKPEPHSDVFSPEDQENPSRKVPFGHKEYVHLSSCGKLDDSSGCFITNMSLCEGDGSENFPLQQFYMNYHLRSPRYQCYYEFFVTDDIQPLQSVSYANASNNLFEHEDEEDMKQTVIGAFVNVFKNSGCSNIPDLLEKIRLYNMMGSSIAEVIIGERKTAQATASSTSESHSQGSSFEKDGSNQEDQQDPVLVLTPQQLLGMLNLCGGDQDKLKDLIQELTADQSQETARPSSSASTPVASVDREVTESDTVPEQNEAPEQQLEDSGETECKVQ